MPEDAIAVRDVRKTYGDTAALKGVSFTIPRGQVCGLIGPNGAGKTTLIRLLMGILKASSGSLTVEGFDAFEDRIELKRRIGYLPDEPVFYSYLSARETLKLSAAMHGLDVEATVQAFLPLIEWLGLYDELDKYAEDYSRGMKKKLSLLLAMLHSPDLLILDEPTNGLDVEATQKFQSLLHSLSERRSTVLFSTHLMDHVERACSHVVVIDRGGVLFTGALGELRDRCGGARLEDAFLALTRRGETP